MYDGIHFVGQESRPMVKRQAAAALFKDAALTDTLDLTAGVLSRSDADDCPHYGRFLDARRFASMFLDGRCKTFSDCCGLHHDTNIGV